MSSGWSPFLSSSTADAEQNDEYLVREIDMLERAVRDRGELSRRELGRVVGGRYWGPGRYGRGRRAAVKQGRLGHPRRGFYGPPDA